MLVKENVTLKTDDLQKQSESSVMRAYLSKNGVYYLQHITKLNSLPAILNSGFLIPRSKQKNPNDHMGGEGDVTYLSSYQYQPETPTSKILSYHDLDLIHVLLLFDIGMLLDYDNFFAYPTWDNRGYQTEESVTATQIKKLQFNPTGDLKEICFRNSIDLSKYLCEIWVHPTCKDRLFRLLNKANVSSNWFDKIIAREFHPEIKPPELFAEQQAVDTKQSVNPASVKIAPFSALFAVPSQPAEENRVCITQRKRMHQSSEDIENEALEKKLKISSTLGTKAII